MSMCCALLYLIATMNENEATADYQKDTVMDTDMLVCDVDATGRLWEYFISKVIVSSSMPSRGQ